MADPVLDQAPLADFTDPQSGIASIIQQMQNAADRSKPIETVQNANRPVPSTPEELIALLLNSR